MFNQDSMDQFVDWLYDQQFSIRYSNKFMIVNHSPVLECSPGEECTELRLIRTAHAHRLFEQYMCTRGVRLHIRGGK